MSDDTKQELTKRYKVLKDISVDNEPFAEGSEVELTADEAADHAGSVEEIVVE